MLKAVESLISHERTKVGNHSRDFIGTYTEKFTYHWTSICVVNHNNCTFYVDNGGWNTSSTNRAINDYKRHFESIGYTLVEKEEFVRE